MPMKVCIDCGTIFPAEHIGAKRCCLCAAKHGTEPTAEKVYPKPPVDDLTRDVRQADASGKSYGFWRAGLSAGEAESPGRDGSKEGSAGTAA